MAAISEDMYGRGNRRRCVKGRISYGIDNSEIVIGDNEKLENQLHEPEPANLSENGFAENLDDVDADEEPVTIDLSEFLNENPLLTELSENVADSTTALTDCHSQFRVTSSLADPSPVAIEEISCQKDLNTKESIVPVENVPATVSVSEPPNTLPHDNMPVNSTNNLTENINDISPRKENILNGAKPSPDKCGKFKSMVVSNLLEKYKNVSRLKDFNKNNMKVFGKYPVIRCERLDIENFVKKTNIKVRNWPLISAGNHVKSKPIVNKSNTPKKYKSQASKAPKLLSKPISFNKGLSNSRNLSGVKKAQSILIDALKANSSPFMIKADNWKHDLVNFTGSSTNINTTADNFQIPISHNLGEPIGKQRIIKLVHHTASPLQINAMNVQKQKFPIITSVNKVIGAPKTFQLISPQTFVQPKTDKIKNPPITPILPKPASEPMISSILLKDYTVIQPYVEDPTSPEKPKPLLTVPLDIVPIVNTFNQQEIVNAPPEVQTTVKTPVKSSKPPQSVFLNGAIKQISSPVKKGKELPSLNPVIGSNNQKVTKNIIDKVEKQSKNNASAVTPKAAVVDAMQSAFAKPQMKNQPKTKQNLNKQNQPPARTIGDTSLLGCQAYNTMLNDMLFGFNDIGDFTDENYSLDSSIEISSEPCESNVSNSMLQSSSACESDLKNKSAIENKNNQSSYDEERINYKIFSKQKCKKRKDIVSPHDSDTLSASEGEENDATRLKLSYLSKRKRQKLPGKIDSCEKQSVETSNSAKLPDENNRDLSSLKPILDTSVAKRVGSQGKKKAHHKGNEKNTSVKNSPNHLEEKHPTFNQSSSKPSPKKPAVNLRNKSLSSKTSLQNDGGKLNGAYESEKSRGKLKAVKESKDKIVNNLHDKHKRTLNQQKYIIPVVKGKHMRYVHSRYKVNVRNSRNSKIVHRNKKSSRPADIIKEIKTITGSNFVSGKSARKKEKVVPVKESNANDSDVSFAKTRNDSKARTASKTSKQTKRNSSIRPKTKKRIKTLKVLFKRTNPKQKPKSLEIPCDDNSLSLLHNENASSSLLENNTSLNSTFREMKIEKMGTPSKEENKCGVDVHPKKLKSEVSLKENDSCEEKSILSDKVHDNVCSDSPVSMQDDDVVDDNCDDCTSKESESNCTSDNTLNPKAVSETKDSTELPIIERNYVTALSEDIKDASSVIEENCADALPVTKENCIEASSECMNKIEDSVVKSETEIPAELSVLEENYSGRSANINEGSQKISSGTGSSVPPQSSEDNCSDITPEDINVSGNLQVSSEVLDSIVSLVLEEKYIDTSTENIIEDDENATKVESLIASSASEEKCIDTSNENMDKDIEIASDIENSIVSTVSEGKCIDSSSENSDEDNEFSSEIENSIVSSVLEEKCIDSASENIDDHEIASEIESSVMPSVLEEKYFGASSENMNKVTHSLENACDNVTESINFHHRDESEIKSPNMSPNYETPNDSISLEQVKESTMENSVESTNELNFVNALSEDTNEISSASEEIQKNNKNSDDLLCNADVKESTNNDSESSNCVNTQVLLEKLSLPEGNQPTKVSEKKRVRKSKKKKSCLKIKISVTKTESESSSSKKWYVSERKESTDSLQSEETSKRNKCDNLENVEEASTMSPLRILEENENETVDVVNESLPELSSSPNAASDEIISNSASSLVTVGTTCTVSTPISATSSDTSVKKPHRSNTEERKMNIEHLVPTIKIKEEPMDPTDSSIVNYLDPTVASVKVESEETGVTIDTTPLTSKKRKKSKLTGCKRVKSDSSMDSTGTCVEAKVSMESSASPESPKTPSVSKHLETQTSSTPSSGSKNQKKNYCPKAVILPFSSGWMRELVHRSTEGKSGHRQSDVYYSSPEGSKLRSMREISTYLSRNPDCKLTLENFTYYKELIYREPFEIERSAKHKSVLVTPFSKKETPNQTSMKKYMTSTPKKSPLPSSMKSEKPPKTSTPKSTVDKKSSIVLKIKNIDANSVSESNSCVSEDSDSVKSRPSRRKVQKVPFDNSITEKSQIRSGGRLTRNRSSTSFNTSVPDAESKTTMDVVQNQISTTPSSSKKSTIVENFLSDAKSVKPASTKKRPKLKFMLSKNVDSERIQPPCSPRCVVASVQWPSIRCAICLCWFHQYCIPKLAEKVIFACKPCTTAKLALYENERKSVPPPVSSDEDSINFEDMDVSLLFPEVSLIEQSEPTSFPSSSGTTILPGQAVTSVPGGVYTSSTLVGNSYKGSSTLMTMDSLPNAPHLLSHLLHPNTPGSTVPVRSPSQPLNYQGSPLAMNQNNSQPLIYRYGLGIGVRLPSGANISLPNSLVIRRLADGRRIAMRRTSNPSLNNVNISTKSAQSANQPVRNISEIVKNMILPSTANQTVNKISADKHSSIFTKKRALASIKYKISDGRLHLLDNSIERNEFNYSKKPKLFDLSSSTSEASEFSWDMNKLMSTYKSLSLIFKQLSIPDLLRAGQVCSYWKYSASQSNLWEKVSLEGLTVTNWEKCCLALQKYGTKYLDLTGIVHKDVMNPWEGLETHVVHLTTIQEIVFDQIPPSLLKSVAYNVPLLRKLECHFVTTACSEPEIWTNSCEIGLSSLRYLGRLVRLKIGSGAGIVLKKGADYLMPYLPNLRHVALTGFNFHSNVNLESLSQQKELISLELGDCKHVEPGIYALLGTLSKLKSLRLENGGSIDDSKLTEALGKIKGLEILELMNFKISSKLASCLKELKYLIHVNIWPDNTSKSALINRNLFSAVSNCKDLKYLCWGIITEGESIPEVLEMDGYDELTFENLFHKLVALFPECRVEVKCVPRNLWKEFCSTRK